MEVSFSIGSVDVDGIKYQVAGKLNPLTEEGWHLIISTNGDQNIAEHLKDGVVEDIVDAVCKTYKRHYNYNCVYQDPIWEEV